MRGIKQLTVKVFEFNTETYYMKTLKPFNTGIELTGLDPAHLLTRKYDNFPSNF